MTASLFIQTAVRNDKTYLQKSFCTTPFKVADITEDKSEKGLRLMLMSSSPGILDDDDYHIKIELAETSSLELQTQSYQRLFSMKNSALQTMEIYMEKSSSFYFLPHPSVPHAASRFIAKNKIFLSQSCTLIWGEVLTCGRKLCGEIFQFSKYHATTEIFLRHKLVVKENLLLQPAVTDMKAIGQLEGYTHQATLFYLNESTTIDSTIKKLIDWLDGQPGIIFGITSLPVSGLIVRLLGHKGEQLHDCLKSMAQLLTEKSLNEKNVLITAKPAPDVR